MKKALLAIETSCDETAAAVIDITSLYQGQGLGEISLLSDVILSQVKLHAPYGGVVPELAAREHITSLPLVVEQALYEAKVNVEDVAALVVTGGPGLKGCLMVGLAFAKGFSYIRKIPLIIANHLEGHIFAGELLSADERPKFPMLTLIVSGGHTELLYVAGFRNYQLLAKTRDDAAGEAFDKIATIIGLSYPGGPELARRGEKGNAARYSFPLALPDELSSFSFSGLKTAVLRCVEKNSLPLTDETVVSDLAASAQAAIVTMLADKALCMCEKLKPRSFLLTGGVAANKLLRQRLQEGVQRFGVLFCVPPFRWCTDNAAMIGALGARIIERDFKLYAEWGSRQNGSGTLGPGVTFAVDARPRWPLSEVVSVL